MKDEAKTKKQLLNELVELRQLVSVLDKSKLEVGELYRTLFETSPDAIGLYDLDGKLLIANRMAFTIFGYEEADAIDKTITDFVVPEERERKIEQIKTVLERDIVLKNEYKGLRKDGTIFNGEEMIALVKDLYGKPKFMFSSIRDITERKKAEEALKKSVQLLIDTGEMARVGGWELDLSTKEVSWTEEVGRIHGVEAGYKPKLEEALNFYAPESRPGIEAAVKKVAETGEPYDLESLLIPRGSQDKIWVRSLGRPVYSGGKIVKLAGTFQNIDKYKKAEEEYKTVLLTAMDGFTIDDMQGRILYVNDAYCRLMGYTRDELLTMRISDIEAVERQEETAQHLKKIMEVGGDHFETHYRCKDGRIVDVEISANYIDTGGGRLFVFVRDITERRQAEVALRQTVENFRRSLDESPLGVCIVTKEGELIYVNQAMLDFDGGDSIEEFKKTPLNQRYTPESFAESRIRREKRKREDHGPSEYDISIVTKDGKIRHLHVFRKNIVWDGERQFLVLYNDITERKQAEEDSCISSGERDPPQGSPSPGEEQHAGDIRPSRSPGEVKRESGAD